MFRTSGEALAGRERLLRERPGQADPDRLVAEIDAHMRSLCDAPHEQLLLYLSALGVVAPHPRASHSALLLRVRDDLEHRLLGRKSKFVRLPKGEPHERAGRYQTEDGPADQGGAGRLAGPAEEGGGQL